LQDKQIHPTVPPQSTGHITPDHGVLGLDHVQDPASNVGDHPEFGVGYLV